MKNILSMLRNNPFRKFKIETKSSGFLAKDQENSMKSSNAVSLAQTYDSLADDKPVQVFDVWESNMNDRLIGRNIQIELEYYAQ